MSKMQFKVAAEMLDMAADHFANHHCNDYEIENTPANREFVQAMIADSDYPADVPNVSKDGSVIYLMDWQVMRYCYQLLKSEVETAA